MLDRTRVEELQAAGGDVAELCRMYLRVLDAPLVTASEILAPGKATLTGTSVWADWSEEGRSYRLLRD